MTILYHVVRGGEVIYTTLHEANALQYAKFGDEILTEVHT